MATIDGVAPSRDTVATGEYTGSQSLFIYLKPAHFDAVPGIRDFAAEFVSDAAAGADGYLVDLGLVPLTDSERRKMQEQIASLASPD
jgi:phosphate transport system substrate-binding protein